MITKCMCSLKPFTFNNLCSLSSSDNVVMFIRVPEAPEKKKHIAYKCLTVNGRLFSQYRAT